MLPTGRTYNLHKYQKQLRSSEGGAARAFAFRERLKTSGPTLRISDFLPGAGLWQLPERVYLSPALGVVGGDSAFGVPSL